MFCKQSNSNCDGCGKVTDCFGYEGDYECCTLAFCKKCIRKEKYLKFFKEDLDRMSKCSYCESDLQVGEGSLYCPSCEARLS